MRIIQTNHQCAKFLDKPIDAPRITFLGLKFSFPIHKFQTWKPDQKVLSRDMQAFQILDWNSNFQSPLVWTNEKLQRFFFHKDLFTIKNPIDKIYSLLLLSIKKRTITVP